jgi:hypothetical protein
VEEVVRGLPEVFSQTSAKWDGRVRRGVLTRPDQLLSALRRCQAPEWTCVVMNRATPDEEDCVLLCLPPVGGAAAPDGGGRGDDDDGSYILMDARPRPEFGTDNAYARLHGTAEDLLAAVRTIFPAADLGPGGAPPPSDELPPRGDAARCRDGYELTVFRRRR